MQVENFKQAAQISLDERWYPISKAESVDEMDAKYYASHCELCQLQKRRGFLISSNPSCGKCPLKDIGAIRGCGKEYDLWVIYTTAPGKDFHEAHKQVLLLVKRLEKIAGITQCEVKQ